MSSEPQSQTTASASDPRESDTRLCDMCESEPAVVFCVGGGDAVCDLSIMEDNAPYGYCVDCNMRDDHDRNPVRCSHHSIIEWTFEDAFHKFGFGDGNSYHNYSQTVGNDIVNLGYVVVMDSWGMYNLTITQIIRPHGHVIPRVMEWEGETVLLSAERVAELGVQMYPPEDFMVGGYDPRPVSEVLPHDIIDTINNYDFPGFVKLDIGPEGVRVRVLKMRGGNIALEAFKSLAPDDVLCGICQQTSAEMVMEPLTKVREAELKRLLAVPRCASEAPHLFHRACLKEWLQFKPNTIKCPLCRSVVVGTPTAGTIPSSQETEV
jgi:hypothetical protein